MMQGAIWFILFFNWRKIALQCCIGFCGTAVWISRNTVCVCVYIYVCVCVCVYVYVDIYISPPLGASLPSPNSSWNMGLGPRHNENSTIFDTSGWPRLCRFTLPVYLFYSHVKWE